MNQEMKKKIQEQPTPPAYMRLPLYSLLQGFAEYMHKYVDVSGAQTSTALNLRFCVNESRFVRFVGI